MLFKNRIALKAKRECGICRGHGEFYENHGPELREPMVCACVFKNAPKDPASWQMIDEGYFIIIPDPQPEPENPISEDEDE